MESNNHNHYAPYGIDLEKYEFDHEAWCDTRNNISKVCNCMMGYPLEVVENLQETIAELELKLEQSVDIGVVSELNEIIEKLEKEKESIRGFALDYQLWVKDFLIGLDVKDSFCFMTFQGMRKQAYTHAKTRGEEPKWGDESYFDNQFGKLTTLEETIKAKDALIEKLEQRIKDIEWRMV